MSRKIARNPNQILLRKPNLFPASKLTELNWGNCSLKQNTSNDDLEKPDTEDGIDADKLLYLRNRFNKPDCGCSPGSETKS